MFNSELFNTNLESTYRIDEFKQFQSSAKSHMKHVLNANWSANIENLIKKNFSNIGIGWFNMEQTNKESYEFSKLKKFMELTRIIMQDALQDLA